MFGAMRASGLQAMLRCGLRAGRLYAVSAETADFRPPPECFDRLLKRFKKCRGCGTRSRGALAPWVSLGTRAPLLLGFFRHFFPGVEALG